MDHYDICLTVHFPNAFRDVLYASNDCDDILCRPPFYLSNKQSRGNAWPELELGLA